MFKEWHLWYAKLSLFISSLLVMISVFSSCITLYRAHSIVDRRLASVCAICTSICSCYHSCSYRFTLLRGCVAERLISYHIKSNHLNDARFSIWLIVNSLFSSPDPTYVVAPVLQSRSSRDDLKKLFAGSIRT